MKIAVDFDNVIYNHDGIWRGGKLSRGPIPGAIEALQQLTTAGHIIIINSTRNWSKKHRERIAVWLEANLIPYHKISIHKPNADLYIDDKAIKFQDWGSILARMNNCRQDTSMRVLGINIKSPSNVGRLIRNAGEFAAGRVYLFNCASPTGMFKTQYVTALNIDQVLGENHDHQTVAFHLAGSNTTLSLPPKCLLIFGGETHGLPNTILGRCDFVIKIPSQKIYSCLTVDTAAGIAFNRWYEQWRIKA